jgi:anti-sigma factor RsiW
MNHITGDDLVAYALDEVEAGTRAATAAHLEACAACRAAHAEIVATLSLAARLEVPARGEHYGAEVWARIEGRLDRGAEGPRGTEVPPPHRSRAWMLPWLAAAAVTLIAVGAYWLGRHSVAPPTVVETVEERAAPDRGAIRERVVLAALGEHLDRTERGLVQLVNADAGARIDITAEQTWARDLLEANRLYRQAASGADAPALSQVLDDLEPVLLEIANSPSRLTSEEFRALRERIEAGSLVFKVRVTGADVRARQRALLRPGEL